VSETAFQENRRGIQLSELYKSVNIRHAVPMDNT